MENFNGFAVIVPSDDGSNEMWAFDIASYPSAMENVSEEVRKIITTAIKRGDGKYETSGNIISMLVSDARKIGIMLDYFRIETTFNYTKNWEE